MSEQLQLLEGMLNSANRAGEHEAAMRYVGRLIVEYPNLHELYRALTKIGRHAYGARNQRITKAERDFHAQRRMFYIELGSLYWAPVGSTESHAEWLNHDERWFGNLVRGYVDMTGVYLYQGLSCEGGALVERSARGHAKQFLEVAGTSAPVYCGLIPGAIGERWKPAKCLGTLADVIATCQACAGGITHTGPLNNTVWCKACQEGRESPGPERRFVRNSPDSEWCETCGNHIRNHYGGVEYRCDPRW